MVTSADRSNLTYIDATINEVQRLGNIGMYVTWSLIKVSVHSKFKMELYTSNLQTAYKLYKHTDQCGFT